jgi:hypothetical protein
MKMIESQGEYTVKATGAKVNYTFSFMAFDNLQDAIATLGEAKAFEAIQRMVKVDANNTAREKAKSANGHSSVVKQTEEQKAKAKLARQADKVLLQAIKAKMAEAGASSLEELI